MFVVHTLPSLRAAESSLKELGRVDAKAVPAWFVSRLIGEWKGPIVVHRPHDSSMSITLRSRISAHNLKLGSS